MIYDSIPWYLKLNYADCKIIKFGGFELIKYM